MLRRNQGRRSLAVHALRILWENAHDALRRFVSRVTDVLSEFAATCFQVAAYDESLEVHTGT
jgi:ferric-dicitrate binding protein FerR (iron transport regulator)